MLKTPSLSCISHTVIGPFYAGFIAVLILLSVSSVTTFAQGEWVPDELLVGFRGGISAEQAENVYRAHGANKIEEIRRINVHRIKVPAHALDAIEHSLSRRPEIKFVERNRRVAPDQLPNDPSYPNQWHLPKIDADLAWEFSEGLPEVVIAILDSGVDPAHPDLAAKLVSGFNFYNYNTDTTDGYGHGTKVAGAAAAIGNNGTGVASVAWRNSIMPIRVTDTAGYGYYSTIANGLTYAVDHGAKVMNVSFAAVAGSGTIQSAAQYVMNHGGLVVAAAGNCGCFDSTAENPYILSVSGTDQYDNLASWSSRGTYVDLSAPGVSIYTTTNGGGYAAVSGTSFSSPITAGVVALMISVNPGLSPAQIESLLESNADDFGAAGYDTLYGFGRVNAHRAVAAAASTNPLPDTMPPSASITAPANGATVNGIVQVAVSASDDTGVSRVDLYLDGNLHSSDNTAPYSFFWDTTLVNDGSHSLVARAVDAGGNVGTSATVSVSVNNAPDSISPTVNISAVGVSRHKLTVNVSATDNVGVTKVELYVDDQLKATDTSNPYSFSLNVKSISNGTHTLQARAYDAAGNVGISSPVPFSK
ncbi:MAG: S8 family serine peptidase [Deltaproteobacteria bacterium]|nr:S8 family serine peptidase [Deltaproteobacteria bacterium]